jgi:hypothetical protein
MVDFHVDEGQPMTMSKLSSAIGLESLKAMRVSGGTAVGPDPVGEQKRATDSIK